MKRIDVLPDDVLLEIFDFYVDMFPSFGSKPDIEGWKPLVHVCRQWRYLVLGSPRRLHLRLYYSLKISTRDKLDIWPALLFMVQGDTASSGTDNFIAALAHRNRVWDITVTIAGWQWEEVLGSMQVSFPELARLQIWSRGGIAPVIPDSFLGGSAPRLRHLWLDSTPFPGLPKLLSSATHLVSLVLIKIPHSGYISPEAMVALLSVLSSLRSLTLEFESPQSHPDWESRILPPPKRSIIPALGQFRFEGVTEYLEELVTCIDAPQLETLRITFFNQIDIDTPRLAQFINHTPKLRACDEAHVQFGHRNAGVKLRYQTFGPHSSNLLMNISCSEPNRQLSFIGQVCNSALHPPSMVEDLYIERRYQRLVWKNDTIENTLWLQLLLPFKSVKNLYLSKKFAPGIVAALRELVGGRLTVVLPSLQTIFVEGLEPSGPLQENIGQFVAARRHSGHPITISIWDRGWT